MVFRAFQVVLSELQQVYLLISWTPWTRDCSPEVYHQLLYVCITEHGSIKMLIILFFNDEKLWCISQSDFEEANLFQIFIIVRGALQVVVMGFNLSYWHFLSGDYLLWLKLYPLKALNQNFTKSH